MSRRPVKFILNPRCHEIFSADNCMYIVQRPYSENFQVCEKFVNIVAISHWSTNQDLQINDGSCADVMYLAQWYSK